MVKNIDLDQNCNKYDNEIQKIDFLKYEDCFHEFEKIGDQPCN